jgi:hypothetical protein
VLERSERLKIDRRQRLVTELWSLSLPNKCRVGAAVLDDTVSNHGAVKCAGGVLTTPLDQPLSGPRPDSNGGRYHNYPSACGSPVEKRLVLKRETKIRKRPTSEAVAIPVSLRKQRHEVGRN